MESDCIFCRIIAKELPADIIAENDHVLVVKDIAPKATIHYLIIPKKHYKDLQAANETAQECSVACSLMSMARSIAAQDAAAATYRLIVNNGYDAGQRVFHLHMHFLAGSRMPEF